MPVPKPSPDEKEDDFMSRCLSKMADEDPNMDNKQRVAICFAAYRQRKKKGESMDEEYSESKQKKYDEQGRIIVAENVKLIFNGTMDFSE